MGAYCTINPQVRSRKTGELVQSKLFADLKKAVGYNNARKAYLLVRSDDFIEEHEQELSRDENGEFTLSSLKSVPELAQLLGVRICRTHAAGESGAYVPVPATRENIREAEKRSMEYNAKSSNEFVALPEIYEDNDGSEIVQVQLVHNTPDSREKASQISRKQILVSRLDSMLGKIGIEQGALDIILDRLREDGMSEYDAAVAVAENLEAIVKKSKGADVTVEMGNELADLVYVALWGSPLLDRLFNAIADNNLAPEILGQDTYDAITAFYE